MKCILIRRYGSSEVLEFVQREPPSPGPRQCLIEGFAAGVNPIDWKIRKGMFKWILRACFPVVLGYDYCGRVKACGEQASRFKEGDWVYGLLDDRFGSAYAEYAVSAETVLARKPEQLSAAEAAALPVAGLTALQALRDEGGLKPEAQLLVIGASGGVGHFAVQIGKAMGAEVAAVCGPANLDWVRELGADRVIDYSKENYLDGANLYDVILDAVATTSFSRSSHALKPGGVYITTLPGPGILLQKFFLAPIAGKKARFIIVKPSGKDLEFLNGLIENGKFRPIIDNIFPWHEVKTAHDTSEAGHVRGKLVLQIKEAQISG